MKNFTINAIGNLSISFKVDNFMNVIMWIKEGYKDVEVMDNHTGEIVFEYHVSAEYFEPSIEEFGVIHILHSKHVL